MPLPSASTAATVLPPGNRERGRIAKAPVAKPQLHLSGTRRDQVGDAVAVEVAGGLAGQGHAGTGNEDRGREGAVAVVQPRLDRAADDAGEVEVAVAVEVRGNRGTARPSAYVAPACRPVPVWPLNTFTPEKAPPDGGRMVTGTARSVTPSPLKSPAARMPAVPVPK